MMGHFCLDAVDEAGFGFAGLGEGGECQEDDGGEENARESMGASGESRTHFEDGGKGRSEVEERRDYGVRW